MGKTHAQLPASDVAGRRRFLQLVAGSAAAMMIGTMAGPRMAAAQSGGGTKKKRKAGKPAKDEAELKRQREYVAATLKTVRDYVLPSGSEIGFQFRPMRKMATASKRRSR